MANTADISRGMILKLDGSLYSVVEFGENKTARAAAKVWAKLKGVDNSRTIEKTWNSGDTIFPVRVEKREISSKRNQAAPNSFSFLRWAIQMHRPPQEKQPSLPLKEPSGC